MDDVVQVSGREGGSGKNLTQMYMRLMTTRCKKQNPPIVCGVCARSLSGAVEAAGVQFLDMASAWPGACRTAHPARRRRWTTRADTIVSGRRLIALCSSWVVQCFNGGLRPSAASKATLAAISQSSGAAPASSSLSLSASTIVGNESGLQK